MAEDRRNDRGRFTTEFPDGDFVSAVRDYEPAGTKEIADLVGCTPQNADYRLRQLEEAGKVRSKMVGNSLVWMLPN